MAAARRRASPGAGGDRDRLWAKSHLRARWRRRFTVLPGRRTAGPTSRVSQRVIGLSHDYRHVDVNRCHAAEPCHHRAGHVGRPHRHCQRRSSASGTNAFCLECCPGRSETWIRHRELLRAVRLPVGHGRCRCLLCSEEQEHRRLLSRRHEHPVVGCRLQHLRDDAQFADLHWNSVEGICPGLGIRRWQLHDSCGGGRWRLCRAAVLPAHRRDQCL